MNKVSIDPQLCDRSPFCPARRVCPKDAIVRDSQNAPFKVLLDQCVGCLKCIRVCPMQAIRVISSGVSA